MTDPPTSVDQTQRILEERARALAQPQQTGVDRDTVELLMIRVAAERYGIGLEHLREVRPLEALTPIPHLSQIWAGLVNLRGVLYPVLDTARYLGLEAGDGGQRQVVLLASDSLIVGLLADEVVGLRSLQRAEIRPPLATDPVAARRLVTGVTADLLLLLDAEALLDDPRLVVEEETF
jgi:purine-binding chemotaxis protein CheW